MRLTVNGREHVESAEALSVAALVARLTEARRGVAVAVNGTVVPRSTWETSRLADGDAVEVLTATQGG
jgi:sulfur carrier protein